MIQNLPTPDEFYKSGKELLDFSWDIVIGLLGNIQNAIDWNGLDEAEISEEYWSAARRKLTTSLSTVQQGIEIILKGKVAEVSPYILLSQSPSLWPSPNTTSIEYSDFRTIDAQDLIKTHNLFCEGKLESEFLDRFNKLRKKRNILMHSPKSNMKIEVKEVIETILYMHKSLFPKENWLQERLRFIKASPECVLYSDDYSTENVCQEAQKLMQLLSRAEVMKYFSIDIKQRKYYCEVCWKNIPRDSDVEIMLAELHPKGSDTTKLYCPICNKVYVVIRKTCNAEGCKGNVLSIDDGLCLTCHSNL